MNPSIPPLAEVQPAREFLVGLDSDGCVFDTMELKHCECCVPMFVKHFRLQAVSRLAREVWEFVNLRSRMRGISRFPALSNSLNLLAGRPEIQARGVGLGSTEALDLWIAGAGRLTPDALREAVLEGAAELTPVLEWSAAVDASIEDIGSGVPPFPGVRESLARLVEQADVMVVADTPTPLLEREWNEQGLAPYVRRLAGQEQGSKAEHLKLAAGSYAPKHVLMVGDAPVDFKAARSTHALFYPIVPGQEESSWMRFFDEALDRFLNRRYAGEYEEALIREFNASLLEKPPWAP